MKFLVDENIAPMVVQWLRARGHDVRSVAESWRSFDDETLLRLSKKERRIFLTKDKDFGALVFQQNRSHAGVILLRLRSDSSENTIRILARLLTREEVQRERAFIVVDEHTIRIT